MRITVVGKIITGFVLFGLLLLCTSILSYWGLSSIRDSAQLVAKEKMPVQAKMLAAQTQILNLDKVSLQGYFLNQPDRLNTNFDEFSRLSSQFRDLLTQLDTLPLADEEKQSLQQAVQASSQYLTASTAMYELRRQALQAKQQISEYYKALQFSGGDAGANLLDMAELDGAEEGRLASVVGAGGRIDNIIITLLNASKEYLVATDAELSTNIEENLVLTLGDLNNNVDYINRLAEGVDTDGLMAAFNEQYQIFVNQFNGEEGLISQQRHRIQLIVQAEQQMTQADESVQLARQHLATLFAKVNGDTLDGQNAILDVVQSNIVKTLVILGLALVLVVIIGTMAARSISRPLEKIRASLSIISQGDLTHKADTTGNDEFAALAQDVNQLSASLHQVVERITRQEGLLNEATRSSQTLSQKTLQQVEQQTRQIRQTATHTEQVRATSKSNLGQIQESQERLNRVLEQTARASELVGASHQQIQAQAEQAVHSGQIIERLDNNSRNIGGILDVIKTIAAQTNLLALNAAIEAARAGEQGRGFAVVADEVRTLANRTHQSTEEIEQMILSLQSDAGQAVAAIETGQSQAQASVGLIEKVNDEIGVIREIIEALAKVNVEIVSDTENQDELLDAVTSSLQQIVELTEQSGQSTRQSSDAIAEVGELMHQLNQAVARFKL
ncbi:methyl-accepting chemotaxis protein [Bowmanella yangjiangensis]|uniref:HAMP domain-containing protein n=1 Tax=Bowmanella yangjiangensis TaxID=2811230 RepID=A0ABS3CRV8_9ALTE|nr:methyl-accepting chemotaxis protein [Bowmanella yangjiangensis]MBN7819853.1 HAMP domain-containing protein [Bowmanella yangjiangensis]